MMLSSSLMKKNPYQLAVGTSLFAAKKGFNDYLNFLTVNNIADYNVVREIENTMYYHLDKGHNPVVFYDENGIIIGNKVILYRRYNGLGVDPVTAAKLAKEASDETKRLIDRFMSIPFVDKTFGAVFENGFNLSCWNSTFTPSKVQAELSKIHGPFFKKAFTNLEKSAENRLKDKYVSDLNFLLKAVDICYDMYVNKLPKGANWRSCSRKAIQYYVDFMTSIKAGLDHFINQMGDVRGVTITTTTVPSKYMFLGSYINNGGQPFTWSEAQHGKATYRSISVIDAINLFETTEVEEDKEDKGLPSAPVNIQQAGFGLVPTLLLGGLLLGGYAFVNKTQNSK